ncbi:MAG TPA: hypothetical protein VF202_06450 [Trueperaceae bacterium]
MFIRKLLVVLAFAALAATAAAQPDFNYNSEGGDRTRVRQQIELTIPTRVALHITDTDFALDLNHLEGVGAGCRMVPKGVMPSDYNSLRRYALGGQVVSIYPAVVLDQNGNVAEVDGTYQKGTLVCRTEFVVQKFANTGWELTADVDMTEGSGKFGIRDDALKGGVPDGSAESNYRHLIGASADGLILAHSGSPTGGWLDDKIEELFWFDGTETPGDKTITVTFVLTSKP